MVKYSAQTLSGLYDVHKQHASCTWDVGGCAVFWWFVGRGSRGNAELHSNTHIPPRTPHEVDLLWRVFDANRSAFIQLADIVRHKTKRVEQFDYPADDVQ